MPKGRQRVDTFAVNEAYRARINDFIRKQVELGGQCYIVCPSIESKEDLDSSSVYYEPTSISSPFSQKSNDLELKDVYSYTEKLRTNLPDIEIEFLHGKMKADEKEEIMKRFASGDVKVLVSTTVIEVGINVPNASLMIVENADRFGLSQLHQLRGRVGRGKRKSYCILVSDSKNETSQMRLNIMRITYDGYDIADKDLAMRGPGDFFSSNSNENFRQSGGLSLRFAKLCDDTDLMQSAFGAAKQILSIDPSLSLPDHLLLKQKLGELLKNNSSSIS
jgi:ATP-dependent DNA helicase RecG